MANFRSVSNGSLNSSASVLTSDMVNVVVSKFLVFQGALDRSQDDTISAIWFAKIFVLVAIVGLLSRERRLYLTGRRFSVGTA